MSIRIKIPYALCARANGQTHVAVQAADVGEALRQLSKACPELGPLLWDDTGSLRSQVNVYVNDVHARYLDGTSTPLRDGDQVYVVPLVMGG
jgi:molybdopterin converting factor small subunit